MYVPIIRKIISSYNVIFDEGVSSTLANTSQSYSEAMAMRPSVKYITCATFSREQTGDIITFKQSEEGKLLSESRKNAESGYKSNNNSIMPPLLIEEEMDVMDSGDE